MAKKMTDAEQREHLIKTYRELDANQDGSLTIEEFTKGTKGYGKILRESVWNEFNENKDDSLSLDEYLDSENTKPTE
ncbi:EF-hand domain-containing protein [Pseudomonas sp. TH08]|uniref:EF-hand domain-containing protein n=1 Tax=unclassified Pseudomonas TaxID=196821 RepID=UPI0019142B86|nr:MULTISPECIES: EF-hand domain-containing protein [unclassified Pseudomonas]MBK5525553.1 EF-hand domain-containing protein [Pseudomonas sp. TH06]MBK5535833.1 EF-hand domain-containing protein [Pseudomonas sp. TH08]